ncbi:alpha-1,6- mannosyltransferase, variant 2 [Basidiobolus ranarum]
MFAYYFVLIAYSYWLRDDHSSQMKMIKWFTTGLVIFRFELVLLLGPILLLELYRGRIGFWETLRQGVISGLVGLVASLIVDSYFWNQIGMYPEGYVFWFNAILGKSTDWGVSPFHTYFTNFLPKLLLSAAPLALYGSLVDRRTLHYLLPIVTFIFGFSFLGHKEWRFIVYSVPIFNFAAAVGLVRLYRAATKSKISKLLFSIVALSLLMSFLISTSMLLVSSQNYPGGVGLLRVHEIESSQNNVYLHIDTYSATTGASRFGELNENWRYSKNESHHLPQDYARYTHLLTEAPAFHAMEFEILEPVNAFDKIEITPLKKAIKKFQTITNLSGIQEIIPFQVKFAPKVWIMKKKVQT